MAGAGNQSVSEGAGKGHLQWADRAGQTAGTTDPHIPLLPGFFPEPEMRAGVVGPFLTPLSSSLSSPAPLP